MSARGKTIFSSLLGVVVHEEVGALDGGHDGAHGCHQDEALGLEALLALGQVVPPRVGKTVKRIHFAIISIRCGLFHDDSGNRREPNWLEFL